MFLTNNANLVVQGANSSHTASSIKVSQENTTLSEIRCYGADDSTNGEFRLKISSSAAASEIIPLKVESDGVMISSKGIEFEGTALASGQSGISSSGNGGEIRIYTNGNQAFTFGASGSGGDLIVENGDIAFSTAGKGICLGVTSKVAANTLDDYEEGVWDPIYVGSGGSQSVDNGYYRKIGSLCYLSCQITVNSARTSGENSTISGLPFAAATLTNVTNAVSYFDISSSFTGSTIPLGKIVSGNSVITLSRSGGTNMENANDLVAGQTGSIGLSVTYITV